MKPGSPAQEVLLLTITTHSARYLTHQPSLCYLLLLLLTSSSIKVSIAAPKVCNLRTIRVVIQPESSGCVTQVLYEILQLV